MRAIVGESVHSFGGCGLDVSLVGRDMPHGGSASVLRSPIVDCINERVIKRVTDGAARPGSASIFPSTHHDPTKSSAVYCASDENSGTWSMVRETYTGVMDDQPAAPATDLTLIVKPSCHLCEEAEAEVARVSQRWQREHPGHPVTVTVRNMLDDPDLIAKFSEDVPVVLLDGKVHTFWKVDPERLSAALDATQAQ